MHLPRLMQLIALFVVGECDGFESSRRHGGARTVQQLFRLTASLRLGAGHDCLQASTRMI